MTKRYVLWGERMYANCSGGMYKIFWGGGGGGGKGCKSIYKSCDEGQWTEIYTCTAVPEG